jgi:hypothetical protein
VELLRLSRTVGGIVGVLAEKVGIVLGAARETHAAVLVFVVTLQSAVKQNLSATTEAIIVWHLEATDSHRHDQVVVDDMVADVDDEHHRLDQVVDDMVVADADDDHGDRQVVVADMVADADDEHHRLDQVVDDMVVADADDDRGQDQVVADMVVASSVEDDAKLALQFCHEDDAKLASSMAPRPQFSSNAHC